MKPRLVIAVAAALAVGAGPLASAQQPAAAPPAFAAPNLTASGARALAASCAICHGTDGRAAPQSTLAGLAGRSSEELVLIMTQFRDGSRANTIMQQIVRSYSDAELAAIADYFAAQPR
jgi:cytochrome c553